MQLDPPLAATADQEQEDVPPNMDDTQVSNYTVNILVLPRELINTNRCGAQRTEHSAQRAEPPTGRPMRVSMWDRCAVCEM